MQYSSNIAELAEVMREYADIRNTKHGDTIEEIFIDQAQKLSCSQFGGGIQGLYQEAAQLAPTEAELRALPQKLNWRIKRDKGRPIFTQYETRATKTGKNAGKIQRFRVKDKITKWTLPTGEIELRIAHRRYQAIGWLSGRLNRYVTGALRNADKAVVFLQTKGDQLQVIIRNQAHAAAEVAAKHGYIEMAVEARVEDMMRYIRKFLDERTDEFNAK